jgi:putative flippase GtrA
MRRQIDQLLANQRARYLIGGVFNTAVNYVLGALIYQTLLPLLNFVVVGLVVTIVSISISFTTYKFFVFRTKGRWWIEYMRAYVVYGSAAIPNIGFMWVLLNWAHVNVWLAQALVTMVSIVISYIGHTAFTFRQSPASNAKPSALHSGE